MILFVGMLNGFTGAICLAQARGVNLAGAVTWAFEFENQPWFRGFRDLATNGVDKPVLNVFRMFGMMTGNRVGVAGKLAYDYTRIRDQSVRAGADINAFATKYAKTASVMVWNYHDDNVPAPDSPVSVTIKGVPAQKVLIQHYRIDKEFSNAYEIWKRMGSPKAPTPEQVVELEKAGQLQLLTSPGWVPVKNGVIHLPFPLPRQAVSLLKLSWE